MTTTRAIVTPTGSRLSACVLLAITLSPMAAWAQASVRVAEILEASGAVEIRRAADAPWTTVRSGQELLGTDALRTRTRAFARVKFEAGLLWLLSAESVLQLGVAVSGTADTNTIRMRLERGRAVATWTPDRSPANPAAGQTAKSTTRAVVATPSGEASILGTEWSLSVDDNGRTALVVLDGAVELSNALASITVRAHEAAEMRIGQPPTLLRVINPRDRVQWVADYSAQPLRFADASMGSSRAAFDLSAADAAEGRTAAAIDRLEGVAGEDAPAGVLLALIDLLIEAGDLERAGLHADTGRKQYPSDARFDAMASRVALFDDRTVESRALANEATVKDPAAVEGWLALGESARNDGDGPIARRAFEQATTVSPGDARGWFGLGSIETEYEAFVPARRWLARALEIDPKGPGYRGELGTVETLANHLDAAKRQFAQARADRPGDYIAMTGEALLALKQGREPEALDLLLRATLLEPNYARAQLYLGVTYYRLRRHDAAIRALNKASQLDEKDPLPHLMRSAIHTDLYEPVKAMQAGRTARDLMPNLKSLNQLASTQKGTANLASSVAFLGFEQWAQHLAQESYYPFWASSHLFLGDRYANEYARTSEYYKGLLTDPTVFGGSPLFQTLLPRAGNYVVSDVTGGYDADGVRRAGGTLAVNGYANSTMPIGYAASIRGGRGDAPPPALSGTHSPVTAAAAIGATPNPRWSLFASGAIARETDHFVDDQVGGDGIRWLREGRRFDAGVNFRPSPFSSAAARVGFGTITTDVPLPPQNPTLLITTEPAEIQLRHTALIATSHLLSSGLELASDQNSLNFASEGYAEVAKYRRAMESAQLYFSARSRVGRAALQADLFVNREQVDLTSNDPEEITGKSLVGTRLLPRLGASVRIASGTLRGAFQHRTRPWAARSTLAPVATAGIPLDDQFVQPGGEQRRVRAQLDWEWSPRMFTSVFAEHQRFTNEVELNLIQQFQGLLEDAFGDTGDSPAAGVGVALNVLRDIARDASRLNVSALSLLERDPNAAEGRVSATGVALNRVVTSQLAVSAQYVRSSSSGTSTFLTEPIPESAGQELSFVPRQVGSFGATWVSPRRWYLSGAAIYRSSRLTRFDTLKYLNDFADSRDTRRADWAARVAGSWESRDKRFALEFTALDIFADRAATSYRLSAKIRR